MAIGMIVRGAQGDPLVNAWPSPPTINAYNKGEPYAHNLVPRFFTIDPRTRGGWFIKFARLRSIGVRALASDTPIAPLDLEVTNHSSTSDANAHSAPHPASDVRSPGGIANA